MKFIHEDDNYTLLIYEVLPEDAGSYACVAINSVGKATCTATLNVESKCFAKDLFMDTAVTKTVFCSQMAEVNGEIVLSESS